jgi:hypothetical protein
METDPLEQLRDVHMPFDPTWWPPAFGWWILLLLVVAAIVWCIMQVQHARARKRPLRQAKDLLETLYAQVNNGSMTPIEFLHAGNEVLKRALVPGLGHHHLAGLAGTRWLTALDEITQSTHFTDGPGKILGNERFTKQPQVDANALHDELQLVLAKVAL